MRLAVSLLGTWLAVSPLEVHIEEDQGLDEAAVLASLEARVGSADDWVITVVVVPQPSRERDQGEALPAGKGECSEEGPQASGAKPRCPARASSQLTVEVTLRRPDGSTLSRRFPLQASDRAGRSRELSSVLAVLVEDEIVQVQEGAPAGGQSAGSETHEQAVGEPSDQEERRPAGRTRGSKAMGGRATPAREMERRDDEPIRWVTANARLGHGGANLRGGAVSDGGVGIGAGGRLFNDRLLVRGAVGWSHSSRSGLTFDGVRVGAGIGVGAGLWRRRVWLGGEVAPNLLVVRIADVTSANLLSSSVELGGHAQLGLGRFTVNLRSGLDLVLPTLIGVGRDVVISWGGPRFFATLGAGARF